MNWNDLPVFIAIAETGTLAGAARRLGVNHSTIFRRLNALESSVGSRLFERLPEGYRLTSSGESVLGHARGAHEAMLAFEREALGRDAGLSGDVRLTTAPNLAFEHVPAALAKLHQRHPAIRVEVVVSDSDYDLSRREADLALRATARPPEHLVGRKVMDLVWHVCGSRAYLERHGTPGSVEELQGHMLIGPDQAFLRIAVFRDWVGRFGRDSMAVTSNSLVAMAELARAGMGLAVLPSDQGGHGLVRLFQFGPPRAAALWLLTHRDLRRVARIKAVSDALYDQLIQYTGSPST